MAFFFSSFCGKIPSQLCFEIGSETSSLCVDIETLLHETSLTGTFHSKHCQTFLTCLMFGHVMEFRRPVNGHRWYSAGVRPELWRCPSSECATPSASPWRTCASGSWRRASVGCGPTSWRSPGRSSWPRTTGEPRGRCWSSLTPATTTTSSTSPAARTWRRDRWHTRLD